MVSTGALTAIIILIGFLGGVMIGIIGVVSIASRREDARYSLDGRAPDTLSRGARRLIGTWVRGPAIRPMGWPDPHPENTSPENTSRENTSPGGTAPGGDGREDTWTWRRETLR